MHSDNTIKKSPHSSADSFYGVEVQGVKYKGRAAELLLNYFISASSSSS